MVSVLTSDSPRCQHVYVGDEEEEVVHSELPTFPPLPIDEFRQCGGHNENEKYIEASRFESVGGAQNPKVAVEEKAIRPKRPPERRWDNLADPPEDTTHLRQKPDQSESKDRDSETFNSLLNNSTDWGPTAEADFVGDEAKGKGIEETIKNNNGFFSNGHENKLGATALPLPTGGSLDGGALKLGPNDTTHHDAMPAAAQGAFDSPCKPASDPRGELEMLLRKLPPKARGRACAMIERQMSAQSQLW